MRVNACRISAHTAGLLKNTMDSLKIHSVYGRTVNFLIRERLLCVHSDQVPMTPMSMIIPYQAYLELERELESERQCHSDRSLLSIGNLKIHFTDANKDNGRVTPGKAFLEPRFFEGIVHTLARPDSFAFVPGNGVDRRLSDILWQTDCALREGINWCRILAGLTGMGAGLTPAGDDFLVGALGALHAFLPEAVDTLGKEIIPRYAQSPDISREFLYHAIEGRFSEPVRMVLAADSKQSLAVSAARLTACGHTSGSDTLAGMLWVQKHLNRIQL